MTPPDDLSTDDLSTDDLSPDDLSPDELSPDELSLDRLTADVSVFQRKKGHRFSSDDVITAWVAMQVPALAVTEARASRRPHRQTQA